MYNLYYYTREREEKLIPSACSARPNTAALLLVILSF